MRCFCCNKNLNDSESTARHPDTNNFLDMCMKCTRETGITPVLREEFEPGEQVEDEYDLKWIAEEDEDD